MLWARNLVWYLLSLKSIYNCTWTNQTYLLYTLYDRSFIMRINDTETSAALSIPIIVSTTASLRQTIIPLVLSILKYLLARYKLIVSCVSIYSIYSSRLWSKRRKTCLSVKSKFTLAAIDNNSYCSSIKWIEIALSHFKLVKPNQSYQRKNFLRRMLLKSRTLSVVLVKLERRPIKNYW